MKETSEIEDGPQQLESGRRILRGEASQTAACSQSSPVGWQLWLWHRTEDLGEAGPTFRTGCDA